MKEGQQQIFDWEFFSTAKCEELWPYLSDTNTIFRKVGATPIQKTSLSRGTPKGFLELTHNKIRGYSVWKEEPYEWEKPFRYSLTRHYKLGLVKYFKLSMNMIPEEKGTRIKFKLWATPFNFFFSYLIRFFIERVIKRRLSKVLIEIFEAIKNKVKPYETLPPKKLVHGGNNRLTKLRTRLIEETKRERIVNRLLDFLKKAEDDELERIHPYALAEYWGEKKYSVLNVFLHATNLEILDFSWDICCPSCKSPKHRFRKMKKAHIQLYCNECESNYSMDFNRNMHMVFTPHPLIRKLANKRYCLGGPGNKPHRVFQHYMDLAEDKYLYIQLEEGSYLFRSHNHDGYLKLNVRDNGADNVTLYITDDDFDGQEVTISCTPNLVISNHSSQKVTCFIDKLNWKQEAIYASEVSSSLDFRNLFAAETLKENSKVKASGVTMLFTDLMNSTEIYLQEGDESAIGRVMSHFKVIQKIVAEERGGIVKTIGDSVMAVFREPVSALKAVQRIQQIFTTSTHMGEAFKLKAGIHFGDCTAVNLNGRIDYFGTTVNIASRLVDLADEKEIMVSEEVYNHPDVKLYIRQQRDKFFVKESQQELKGFDDEEFNVKQIRLERPPMKLVI
ncbi:MAG: adenylate/guanylate cyclase domain-containing protein [Balneolaceae bacterium]|nr:adenylate/guanylate cyclase domain-containing protein [Balneolaceae bacterium]